MILSLLYRKKDIQKNLAYINMYRRECSRRGFLFRLEELENFTIPEEKDILVINRSRDAGTAKRLEKAQIPVMNGSEICLLRNDKAAAYRYCEAHGLPCMPTYNTLPGHFPLVMKSTGGHGGSEVFLVHNEKEAADILAAHHGKSFIYQDFCDTPGRDLRVYIIGNRIAAAMLRESSTDFRSNFSLGGKAALHELNEKERALTERILSDLHIDFAAIDLIYHKGEPVFNELEDAAGARMLYRYSSIDIVHEFFEYISSRIASATFTPVQS